MRINARMLNNGEVTLVNADGTIAGTGHLEVDDIALQPGTIVNGVRLVVDTITNDAPKDYEPRVATR